MDDSPLAPLLALKSKQGEIDAVLRTDLGTESPVISVELLNSLKVGSPITTKIVRMGVAAVQAGRSLWLDTTWLAPSSPFGSIPGGAFEHLDAKIEAKLDEKHERNLLNVHVPALIPVISPAVDDQELRRVRLLREHNPREIALRCRRASRGGSPRLVDRIAHIAKATGASSREIHLLLDEGYVDRVDERRVHELLGVINDVTENCELASIGLLAGSTPKKRNGYDPFPGPR